MQKVLLLLAATLMASSVFATENKISKELAVVKASNEAIQRDKVALANVYDATVQDTGKQLVVTLKWKDTQAACIGTYWLKYSGATTDCEACEGHEGCSCISTECAGLTQ